MRRLIRMKAMTQREFVAKTHISGFTLSRLIRQPEPRCNPSTYRAVASGLGMTPEDLDDAWRALGDDPAESRQLTARALAGEYGLSESEARAVLGWYLRQTEEFKAAIRGSPPQSGHAATKRA